MPTLVNPTGNPDIDGILWGYKWDFTDFLVRFPTTANEYQGYLTITGFVPFSQSQQDAIYLALRNVMAFTPLTFTLTNQFGAGHFRFAQADKINVGDAQGLHDPGGSNDLAEAIVPDPTLEPAYAQGDTWYNLTSYKDPQLGTFADAAGLLHEFGHALGLKHGHNPQSDHGVNFPALPADHDSQEYSVMTYRTFPGQVLGQPLTGPIEYPWTYMQDDIAALQYLYGPNYTANAGATIYSFSPTTGTLTINDDTNPGPFDIGPPFNSKIFLTIWDGGGNDTYDFSNYATGMTIDLGPGNWSTLSADQLAHLGNGNFARGNVANALMYNGDVRSLIENAFGGSGNDAIFGNQVNNILRGGGGTDFIDGLGGFDTADYSDKTAAVSAVLDGVNFSIVSVGGVREDTIRNIEALTGGSGGDDLTGDGGGNTLNGNAGDDALRGMDGADILNGGDGTDYLVGGLGDDVLSGGAGGDALHGQEGNDNVFGGEGDDVLVGLSGNDSLSGDSGNDTIIGDDGDDLLAGGLGNDQLFGYAGNDTENGGPDGDFLSGGIGDDTLTGFDGDDSIHGEEGNDTGYGGLGNDALVGYAGNDTLNGGDGNDTLIGNAGADVLNGDVGNDQIFGYEDVDTENGGVGDDFLAGGSGNDVLHGNAGGDVLDGEDDNDQLFGDDDGDNLNGNFGNDTLFGGNGNDGLLGWDGDDTLDGGPGNDFLIGDRAGGGGTRGNDTFVFHNGTGNDSVADLQSGAGVGDVIDVRDFHFANFTALLAAATNVANGVYVQLDGDDAILIEGHVKADFAADDFLLV